MAEKVKVGTLPAGTKFFGSSGKVVYMILDLQDLPGSQNAPKGQTWAVILSSPSDSGVEYRPGMVRSFPNYFPVDLVSDPGPEGETVLVTNRPDVCHHGTLDPQTGKTRYLCDLPAGHAGPHTTTAGPIRRFHGRKVSNPHQDPPGGEG